MCYVCVIFRWWVVSHFQGKDFNHYPLWLCSEGPLPSQGHSKTSGRAKGSELGPRYALLIAFSVFDLKYVFSFDALSVLDLVCFCRSNAGPPSAWEAPAAPELALAPHPEGEEEAKVTQRRGTASQEADRGEIYTVYMKRGSAVGSYSDQVL